MPDAAYWIRALRTSQGRFAAAVGGLTEDEVKAPSYADGWSIARVASHLGSQAEIFSMFLEAGLSRAEPPGGDAFAPVCDSWNHRPPARQVSDSVSANERFVRRLEALPEAQRSAFGMSLFGMDLDLAGLVAWRLSEHAVHTWDIRVALHPAARLAADAVDLLIDTVSRTAASTAKPSETAETIAIQTESPDRSFVLTTGPAVELLRDQPRTGLPIVRLPAEAFIRLVFGRLDPKHTPADIEGVELLGRLRAVFPGF
jgi:uncharacterized protein (TIGR03083 family)